MFGSKNNQQPPDLFVYVMHDSKVDAYRPPIMAVNDEVLMRIIIKEMRDPRQQQADTYTNSEDFSIFKIGSYQLKTGKITLLPSQAHVINMIEMRAIANRLMIAEDYQARKLQQEEQLRQTPKQPTNVEQITQGH